MKRIFAIIILLVLGGAALWWFTQPAAQAPSSAKIAEAPSALKPVAPKAPEAPKSAPVASTLTVVKVSQVALAPAAESPSVAPDSDPIDTNALRAQNQARRVQVQAQLADTLQHMRQTFSQMIEDEPRIFEQLTAKANGDPAELAKVDVKRQQWEANIVQQQNEIDSLTAKLATIPNFPPDINTSDAQPGAATGGSANDNTQTAQLSDGAASLQVKKQQLEQMKAIAKTTMDQAAAKANGDPEKLAQLEAVQKQLDTLITARQKEIDDLEAKSPQ